MTNAYLTRHFFRALFDFGVFTEAGVDSLKHMLLASIGGLIAGGLLLARVYRTKYRLLMGAPEAVFQQAVLGDELFIIGLPMILAAFATLLVSQSLFPDERDFRILGPLPVPRIAVFRAKLAALILFIGSFILALHVALMPLAVITGLRGGVLSRVVVWALVGPAAAIVAVLAVTSVVGVLMLTVSRTRFHTPSVLSRSVFFGTLVICLPLVMQLPEQGGAFVHGATWMAFVPPAWFVGLEQVLRGNRVAAAMPLALLAITAMAVTSALVAGVYLLLFARFEHLLLRPMSVSTRSGRMSRGVIAVGTPAFRAVFGFTAATCRRSLAHQSILIGLSACGLGLLVNRLDVSELAAWWRGGGSPPRWLVTAAVSGPLTLMFACGLAVRAALALPLEHRANWIFRMTESDATRRQQLSAVELVASLWVVGFPAMVAIPLLWLTMAPAGAALATMALVLVGLIFVHVVLKDWRRIPFTSSLLPGKSFVVHTFLFGGMSYFFFTAIGGAIIIGASGALRRGLIFALVLSLIAWTLRRRRLAMWSTSPLVFEDELPDQAIQLQLWQ